MKLRSAMGATESSPNVVLLISEMEASASIGSLGEELPSLMEEFQSLWRLPPFQSQSIRGERYSICSHLSHRVHLFFFFLSSFSQMISSYLRWKKKNQNCGHLIQAHSVLVTLFLLFQMAAFSVNQIKNCIIMLSSLKAP